jgi:hypothetical protein
VGQGIIVGKVVDADNLNIGKNIIFAGSPENGPADPAKSVDANSYSHNATSFLGFSKFTALGDALLKIFSQCSFIMYKLSLLDYCGILSPALGIYF